MSRSGADAPLTVVTVYDRAPLEPIAVAYADGVEADPTAFRFRNRADAANAVLGVIIVTYNARSRLGRGGMSSGSDEDGFRGVTWAIECRHSRCCP